MDYRVYCHVIGLPDYLDKIVEELEEFFEENNYTEEEAEEYIKKLGDAKTQYGEECRYYIVPILPFY